MIKTELEQTIYNIEVFKQLAQQILKEAKQLGADEAEVGISANKGFTINVHAGDVETVEYHQDKVIDISVYIDKRLGSASVTDIRPESITAAVKAAIYIAKFTDPDPFAGLAKKDQLAFDYPQLCLAAPWHITVEQAIQLAKVCEEQALAFDKRIMSVESSSIATYDAWYIYANSHGFIGSFPHTRHEVSCVVVAKENDEMQRDYCYSVAADPSSLEDISYIATHAAERAINRLGARTIRTAKVPVIFNAEEARGLLGHFVSAIKGGNLYRKSSFLLDHLDKQIFPTFINLQEHPHIAYALGSSPFDNDGVATRSNVFVEHGVLKNYALSVYSARKLGMETTGNAGGVHNLTITSGTKSFRQLIESMHKGVVITELLGQGVNIVSGDYSRGASGFWVENGEIQYSVQGITVASNLRDIYQRIIEVGADIDVRGNIRTGSILIEEMMVAGE